MLPRTTSYAKMSTTPTVSFLVDKLGQDHANRGPTSFSNTTGTAGPITTTTSGGTSFVLRSGATGVPVMAVTAAPQSPSAASSASSSSWLFNSPTAAISSRGGRLTPSGTGGSSACGSLASRRSSSGFSGVTTTPQQAGHTATSQGQPILGSLTVLPRTVSYKEMSNTPSGPSLLLTKHGVNDSDRTQLLGALDQLGGSTPLSTPSSAAAAERDAVVAGPWDGRAANSNDAGLAGGKRDFRQLSAASPVDDDELLFPMD